MEKPVLAKKKSTPLPDQFIGQRYSKFLVKSIYDTMSYINLLPEKDHEGQINPQFDSELKEKLDDVQNANLFKVDPSDQISRKRNNIKNFEASDYLFEN